jgi:hypothetical protein
MFLSVLHDGLLELKEDEGVYDGELVGARQPRPTTGRLKVIGCAS